MPVRGHLLILLLPVLSLCGATEYYVRPTEPTNTSCPAQPCLTLSQYINDSDYYFQSNTLFRFLPGTHHMDRPLHIQDVYNMSLENINNEYPHLVTHFSCNRKAVSKTSLYELTEARCTAVELDKVHDVTLKGVSLTVQYPNVSGITIKYASNVHVQLNVVCFSMVPYSEIDIRIGILIYEASFVEVFLSHASNCSSGLVLQNSNNINIINTTTMYNNDAPEILFHISGTGISLLSTTNATIIDTRTMYNAGSGIFVEDTTKFSVLHTTITHNGHDGLALLNTTSVSIISTSATYSGLYGMALMNTNRISIINTNVMHNSYSGMGLWNPINISFINTTAMYNAHHGMALSNPNRFNIINTTSMHNGFNGVGLWNAVSGSIINTVAMYNGYNGMYTENNTQINIIETSAQNNGFNGMNLLNTTRSRIVNTTVTYNDHNGMILWNNSRISMINTTAVNNGYGGVLLYRTTSITITKSSLSHNGWRREDTTMAGDSFSSADITSLPAVIMLYYSSLHVSECNATSNNISAVKAYASNITASGNVIISNNRAIAGTAFILVQNSILKLEESGHIHFSNNNAINIGGVFYIIDDVKYDYDIYNATFYTSIASTCFLNIKGSRSQTRLTFSNNSAGEGGDVLYGGHIMYGLDGVWNCLESFKNVSSMSQDGLSLITSDPLRVCLCNGTGQPDCLIVADPTTHSIYPGQSINISAVVVGQAFGTVAGSVHAQFLQKISTHDSPQLETWQKIQGVTQDKCHHLEYTIFSSNDMSEAVLILTANNRKVTSLINEEIAEAEEWRLTALKRLYHKIPFNLLKHSHDPISIAISLFPCPAGFMLTSDTPFRCDCNQLLQDIQGVKCYIQDQTIGRSGLVWVGTIMDDNETVVASEYCLLDYCDGKDSNVTLSDPDSQCNYNHSGILCGGCQPGLSLALGSAQCLPCSNKYLALLIPFALAGPALVFFIKLLDLTISQGTINGLIFYANIVKANEYILLPQRQTNPLTLFIAWLNLDLGVETCFFHGLTAYTKTWLQFVFPLYIWTIAGLIIILAKYFDRVAKVLGNNSVPLLATLFLVSYAKLFRTIITVLSYTVLYSSQGHKAVWSADGNVDYLGSQHAPLFAIAVAVLLFLYLPYTLLLFLGQWLHRCNCRLIDHILMKLKPFLDAHYGPLKGKHHYWFGALLLVRATILLISALIPTNHANIVNFCVSIFAIVLMFFGPIVHSSMIVAMFDISFFMNLALFCLTKLFTTTSGGNQDVAAYTLIGIAFVQFLGLIIFKLFSILKRSEKVMACLHKRQPAEDDWELYEEAALLREMESDTEEEDSDESGSIESIPTY